MALHLAVGLSAEQFQAATTKAALQAAVDAATLPADSVFGAVSSPPPPPSPPPLASPQVGRATDDGVALAVGLPGAKRNYAARNERTFHN